MAEILESVISYIDFQDEVNAETELLLDAYGTFSAARIYFDNKLRTEAWKRAEDWEQKAALREATRLIDCLNFSGVKVDPNQFKEFPRKLNEDAEDTVVPKNVEIACYEIALKIIEGFDTDREVQNLAYTSQGFSSARSTYDRSFVLEYLRAGIPSSKAWELLKPYLRDPQEVTLCRAT